jgi:translation initiation factor 2 alpha subunit (eIF-2alpha)
MVKALKGNMIILGLSDKNIEKLKQDMPIKFNLKELGLPDYDVLIFTAKDEQAMYEMMKGAIDPLKTIIKDDNAKSN